MKTNFYTRKVGTPIGFLKVLMIFFISMLSMSLVNAQTTVIIGAGSQNTTAANGAATDPGPMYRSSSTSTFIYSRHHYLYTATELAATGMTAGQLITTLEWNLGLAAASNAPFTFQIWIKNSSLTTVGAGGQLWATLIGSSTQVYNNASTSVSGPGWQTFTLSSPFTYTGGAIEISVNFDMSSGSNPWTTAGFAWLRDPINDRTLSYVGSTPPSTTLPNLRTTRPQLRLTYTSGAGCSAPPTSGTSTALPATTVCPGATVTFGLSGNSTGTGQTYEWLSGPTLSGPWTSMSGVLTSPAFATTVTSSAYWRCKVTCSGQSDTSIAVFKDVASLFPGGTYTINSALPTGGGNYANFTDAVAAIQCGISGPVIFNVDAASGPYTEQITIPAITGTSSTNTITFNGNGRTLQFTPNTTNRHIIKLDGADYVAIKDLR